MKANRSIFLCAATALSLSAAAQTLDISLARPGATIQPTMYGIFFEDINYAADGGLYAELVKNRSFEFPQDALQGWKAFGRVAVRDDGPFERNPHYVRLCDPGHGHKWTGLDNEGFFGIGLQAGATYRFSVWARVPDGGRATLRIEFVDTASMGEQQFFTQERITVASSEWKQYEVVMTAAQTDPKATLRIFLESRGVTVDLEHVSLFPTDTWMGHRNGMRKDLAQALADLKPGIFRFPGGCIVEGTDLETRYNWKNTVGPVENRPLNENRWEYTFPHRFFPDYFQSYGLGFFEFFQLSEEIGAEPLPILSCGLACQFQNNDPAAHVPVDELDPYIQDALDLIEFANGDPSTTWGALRAEMGHPAPFNLKYIGIGNEQWGPEYPARLEPFVKAIRAAHPEIAIVGSSGPNSEGEQFDYLWPEMRRLKADLVDEHFYRPYEWFLSQGARYDNYDRKGPKVFAGEYACHARGRKLNHFYASLLEAAFMTGLERNADIVHMATYAPLFAHVEGWQWRPDLIWYDNLRSMRTASWHVQALYSEFHGQQVLRTTMDGAFVTGAEGQDGLFASSVLDGDKVYVKVVNTSDKALPVTLNFSGLKKRLGIAPVERVRFTTDKLYEDNTLDAPAKFAPVREALAGQVETVSSRERAMEINLPPYCFDIYVFEMTGR
ncbi:MAG: carbohydrate binding domain-containing protein [Bacteroidales bacterium]|nr:carbohydrate binding domain-containing protein [Bacteroidales bacterium]